MTTLDDFKRLLNADPKNTQTLLILADFCDEHGLPYGAGYRALGKLGKLGKTPWWFDKSKCWGWWNADSRFKEHFRLVQVCHRLPDDWFRAIEVNRHIRRNQDNDVKHAVANSRVTPWTFFKAAAKAFGKLPAERQTEILAEVAG